MSNSIRAKKWSRKSSYGTSNSSTTTSRARSPQTAKRSYTPKTLMDLALFYCARRETSRPKLTLYLKRKVDLEKQPEALEWIEEILKEFERMNVINHERFAGMLNREYARRGKGKRYIEQKLKEKGVGEQAKEIEFPPDEELTRATEVAIKALEKSTFRKIEEPFARKQKLLQKLVTQGFDYSVAKKAVEVALKKD